MAKIYSPTPADSHRISEIYITSMAHNTILLLQYPTEEQQRQVQEYAATQFQSSIEKHPETTIVVRELDEENGDIMSFLKYEIHQEAKPEEPSKPAADLYSHNDNGDWYHRYLQVTAAARARNMRQPYIHLKLLCTMPRYQGRGAAHVLIGHLKRIAMETKLPIYIESTMNAVGLYEKLGWKHIDWIRMTIPKEPAGPPEVEYQERCMVWEP